MDDILDERKPREKLILNTHLDTPLQYTAQLESLKDYSRYHGYYKKELNHLKNAAKVFRDPDKLDLNGLIYHLEQRSLPLCPASLEKELDMYLKSMRYNVSIQSDILKKLNGERNINFNLDKNEIKDQKLKRYFFLKNILNSGVVLSASPEIQDQQLIKSTAMKWWNKKGEVWSFEYFGFSMHVGKNLFIFKWENGEYWLASRSHLLMISDIISQRFLLHLTCKLAEINKFQSYPSVQDLTYVYEWGDKLIDIFGNSSFDMLSLWESLCLGILMEKSPDPLWDNSKFLNEMKLAFTTSNSAFQNPDDYLDDLLDFLREKFDQNPHIVAQLYGLFRIWGHPTVDGITAISKLKIFACKERLTNHSVVTKILRKFKETFSINYYCKHHRWPKLFINSDRDTHLFNSIKKGKRVDRRHKDYHIEDWDEVTAGKTFDIDPKYNLGEMISDKSLSHVKDILEAEIANGSIGKSEDRAVLIQWMRSTLDNPLEFLLDVDKNGFGENERVTGACPKEQENKKDARMFGLLTLKKRMYVVLTEALIAEHILPYFPEVTMMDDEITLIKKMHQATSKKDPLSSTGVEKTVILSFDFQKWNTNMREEETKGLFSFLDNLFGFKSCISRTHEMFNPGWIYLADNLLLPELDENGKLKEGPTCWNNHQGGIEGLRQKGWTIFTVILIKMITEALNLDFQLMGQGDNQVLKLRFSSSIPDREVTRKVQEFLDRFSKLLAEVGPPLKKEETWVSSNLYVYGKFLILNSAPLPVSLKRLCKMTSLSNEGTPTLESALSSITANASAGLSRDFHVCLIFSVYSYAMAECFAQHLDFSPIIGKGLHPKKLLNRLHFKIPRDKDQARIHSTIRRDMVPLTEQWNSLLLVALMMFPRCLGGYPVQLLSGFLCRGFPDPVTDTIAAIKIIHPRCPAPLQTCLSNIMKDFFDTSINPAMICQDPTAINWMHPSSPSEQIKRAVFDSLGTFNWITNEVFLNYLTVAQQSQKELTDYLYLMDPFFPRLCKEILAGTVSGSAYDSISRVTKTNVMIKILNQNGIPLKRRVVSSEENYYKSVLLRLLGKIDGEWDPAVCASWLADYWRSTSWGKPIVGSTVASVIEAFKGVRVHGEICDHHQDVPNEEGYVYLRAHPGAQQSQVNNWDKCGTIDPYLGSMTKEKVTSHGKQLAQYLPPMARTAVQLQNVIGWICERDSNLSNLIKRLLTSVTDLNPDLLMPAEESISGSAIHRFQDRATKHGGALSILFTPATWIYLSTNFLVKYAKGSANVNLHFQALLCSAICAISQVKLNEDEGDLYHIHTDCQNCITPIYEEKLEIPEDFDDEIIPSYPENPWCYFPNLNHLLEQKTLLQPLSPLTTADTQGEISKRFHTLLSFQCYQLVIARLEEFENRKTKRSGGTSTYINQSLAVGHAFKTEMRDLLPKLLLRILSFITYELSLYQNVKDKNFFEQLEDRIQEWPIQSLIPLTSLFSDSQRLYELTQFPFLISPPLEDTLGELNLASCLKRSLLSLWDHWKSHEDPNRIIPHLKICNKSFRTDQHPIYLSRVRICILKTLKGGGEKRNLKEFTTRFLRLTNSEDFKLIGFQVNFHELVGHLYSYSEGSSPYLVQKDREFIEFVTKTNYQITEETVETLGKLREVIIQKPKSNINIDMGGLPLAATILTTLNQTSLQESSTKNVINKTDLKDHNFIKVPTDQEKQVLQATFPTTASYKLLSILNLYSIETKGLDMLSFGDGAGGFTLTLMRTFPSSKCFFNSKIDFTGVPAHIISSYVPPALVPFPQLHSRLTNLHLTRDFENDLTKHSYPNLIAPHLSKASILTCDAEGGWEDPEKELKILINLLIIANETRCPIFIFKAYAYPLPTFYTSVSLVLNLYEYVDIVRSDFSSNDNLELYLVGRRCRNIPLDHVTLSLESHTITAQCYFLKQREISGLTFQGVTFQRPRNLVGLSAYTLALNTDWSNSVLIKKITLFFSFLNLSPGNDYNFPEDFWIDLNRRRKIGRFNPQYRSSRLMANSLSLSFVKKLVLTYFSFLFIGERHELIQELSSKGFVYIFENNVRGWGIVISSKDVKDESSQTFKVQVSSLVKNHDILNLLRMLYKEQSLMKVSVHPAIQSDGSFLSIYSKIQKHIFSSHLREGIGLRFLPKSEALHRGLFSGDSRMITKMRGVPSSMLKGLKISKTHSVSKEDRTLYKF